MAVSRRTDEDRVTRAPLTLVLGGQAREVRPLPLSRSRDWKRMLAEALGSLGSLDFTLTDGEGKFSTQALAQAVETVALQIPDKLADLVRAYLKAAGTEITLERFEEEVTDQEVADALLRLLEVTFPFLWKTSELARTMQALTK